MDLSKCFLDNFLILRHEFLGEREVTGNEGMIVLVF